LINIIDLLIITMLQIMIISYSLC